MQLTLGQTAAAMQAVGDYEHLADKVVYRIQTDSRMVEPGDLFICLQGQRFDGHSFAGQAADKGAVAVVGERPIDGSIQAPFLLVSDCLQALGRLAAKWRNFFSGSVIAVTGTAGKTTVKEYLASILDLDGATAKNFKNWNNQLGVPLSILSATGKEKYWILEAGISLPGEMDRLGEVLSPDVAVINNIGPAHLEGLGDCAGVAREKTKLIRYVKSQGLAVFSADYPEIGNCCPERKDIRFRTFSCLNSESEFFGKQITDQRGHTEGFRLRLQESEVDLSLDFRAQFMLENILAAASTASLLGLEAEVIARGIQQAKIPEHRCQIQQVGSCLVIDDSYNANPLSMRCAMQYAKDQAGDNPLVLVLGDMCELGARAWEEHESLGRFIADLNCTMVCFAGDYARQVRYGLNSKGQVPFAAVRTPQEMLASISNLQLDRATFLIKGSRIGRLEQYVDCLVQELTP